MSGEGSGSPSLDGAWDRWRSSTAALPREFRGELLDALHAVEHGRLTLEWPTPDDERRDFLMRFPHPFARVYDRTMLNVSLTLGLSGPLVRMLPVGGLVLRRHLGGVDDDGPIPSADADPDELAQLRALLSHVTSEDVPASEDGV